MHLKAKYKGSGEEVELDDVELVGIYCSSDSPIVGCESTGDSSMKLMTIPDSSDKEIDNFLKERFNNG